VTQLCVVERWGQLLQPQLRVGVCLPGPSMCVIRLSTACVRCTNSRVSVGLPPLWHLAL
jgi:hypothetical protein